MPFYSQGFTLLFLSQSEVLVGRFEKSCHRLPLLWEDEKIIFVLCRTNSCVPRRANTPQIIKSFPGFLFFKSCEWKKDPDTFKRDCRWPNNRCSRVHHTRKSSLSNPPSNEMVTAAPPQKKKSRHYISRVTPSKRSPAAPYVLNLKLLGAESSGSAQACKHETKRSSSRRRVQTGCTHSSPQAVKVIKAPWKAESY